MYRTNTPADVANTGWVKIDTGDGVLVEVPVGFAARLAAIEYDSGERDITSLLPGVVSGELYVQRTGSTVWLDFRDLVCTDPENAWHSWSNVLAPGLRPNRSWIYLPLTGLSARYTVGPVRVSASGNLVVYGVTGQKVMRGLVSFPTPDTPPSSPPGDPA